LNGIAQMRPFVEGSAAFLTGEAFGGGGGLGQLFDKNRQEGLGKLPLDTVNIHPEPGHQSTLALSEGRVQR
jgi:hypothetical protein